MNPERWHEVERVFEEALERSVEERAEFVALRCTETCVSAEVLELLAADEDAGDFLEHPALTVPIAAETPTAIDGYRIVRRLGRGGMGEVYLAVRQDEEFHHRVAIKVLAPGLVDPTLVRRFRSERQILAQLDHANIAHLYGGGTLPDGRPYLVMEYVDGVPLHEFCEQEADLDARLELFVGVCDAVSYAHRNLVLHLDLKPHNVLVTPDGTPKLLDFGIAKLLHGGHEELHGPRPLTPEYASPEQRRGDTLTTASDVYSLGVLLHRLLTGCLPPRNDAASQRHAYGRLCRLLVGDLDAVLQKALQVEPRRRYLTVEQLSDDLRRHQLGFPVLAHADSWRYRLGKLARRRRGSLLGMALGAAIFGSLGAAVWAQDNHIEAQRRQLGSERRNNRDVSTALIEAMLRASERSATSRRPPASSPASP